MKYCKETKCDKQITSDLLQVYIYEHVSLKKSFKEKLHLFDEIEFGCFNFKDKYSYLLFYKLLQEKNIDVDFFITKKVFNYENEMILFISFCESNYNYDVRKKLIKTGDIF